MNIYKIEDVAKQCGLTKRTIRYYEEIGLLFPPERSEGGYRLYSDKHIERLKQILNARDVLGSSLQELQEYITIMEELLHHQQGYKEIQDKELRLEKIAHFEQTVAKQLRIIDQKVEKLSNLRNEISRMQDRVQEAKRRITSQQE